MIQSILQSLKEYLGNPDFYVRLSGTQNYSWDYGSMLEYCIGGILLIVVVSNVFKLVRSMFA